MILIIKKNKELKLKKIFKICLVYLKIHLVLIPRLLNKILIKNKRLKPEVEKVELDQFWKGEFSIGDNIAITYIGLDTI